MTPGVQALWLLMAAVCVLGPVLLVTWLLERRDQ